ncbi:uncharacterized protein LOC125057305 isoform X1 [Pieris napi]|uniref:uncharacterized protein LOC125057305 isoform X1 n=2 Tax=Pieris napi TaxID=78633 RepID=UPI001FBA6B30|nr:uncharacterized protein LOC125057305 isoform X1 [Pieris napi]
MDVGEMKTCGNCKRDIPAVNFTIHTVHCARNIGMCPVCKEPFPHSELQEHHEKMHKLLPCKQCGDSVCGTDLEDHIRDSCAHTMQTCRYCNLDVRRGEMPAHERYCGARTEQCEECGEWVMLKYRRLHTESNHGFIRLDDDPVPFRRDKPKKVINDWPQTNGIKKQNTNNGLNRMPELRDIQPSTSKPSVANVPVNAFKENIEPRPSSSTNGAVPKPKRTNDQPQINTANMATNKVKNMTASRGAIKKRPAPKPPAVAPNPDPKRDLALTRALQRQQEEERERRERSEQNLTRGLPPILNPLEKLEKLRKMDALQNREVEDQSYKDKLNGRVWMSKDVPIGNLLGAGPSEPPNNLETERRRNLPLKGNSERQKIKLKNLKPMTEDEFIERFNYLHMKEPPRDREDRFSQIKSSLRELRRGLNEVTAPYNANPNVDLNQNRNTPSPDDEVKLPCEFCGAPVAADILVQHQTGCRPDLARLDVRKARGSPPPLSPVSPPDSPPHGAVIPCEFCAKSLPIYLISEHQERCGRESNLLFAD